MAGVKRSQTEAMPERIRAVYLGSGCFRMRYNGELAFVRREARPAGLKEGELYVIGWTLTVWGLRYDVIEAVPKRLGIPVEAGDENE